MPAHGADLASIQTGSTYWHEQFPCMDSRQHAILSLTVISCCPVIAILLVLSIALDVM